MDDNALLLLQRWYADQCDGEWEHFEGIEIATLDNPGWRVKVSLGDTEMEERPFDRLKVERAEDVWLHAWIEEGEWHAACGPLNLGEAVDAFLAWASP